ncbi:aromatic ring-hydroxylating dioxygenase subunit alpha [uncultured Sphingosinicella sp.]|uniref:aromatic ring-hydroxylating dioxygenase subunit alpha n=1 Tax=uncultured Sphingosinicella sp. TaxID=478748 RepID=UPI0030D70E1B|tara:strand:+ start:42604 stop:43650 length:1047 start_codon:yes stop_codon:yes gene_type:complete
MFIRESWYVAGWASELGSGNIARTVLGEPVLIFRSGDGAAAALLDRCPHRALPLSMGDVKRGIVRCAYHGMEFDGTGTCVRIPSQDKIPPSARVRAFPLVERNGLLWIWPGDASRADSSKIPDLYWLSHPHWGARGTTFNVKCNWRLIIDNLMDLTHLTFVHGRTIGNAATIIGAETRAERAGDASVRVTRWMMNAEPPPTYIRAGGFTGPVDRWQIINFTLPSLVRIDVGACAAGTGVREGKRVGGIGMQNINLITPETETSSHYFWAQAHDFSPDEESVTNAIFEEIHRTFMEDVDIFEAQQHALARDPSRPVVDLAADRGGVLVRRLIDRALRQEATAIPLRNVV